MKHDWEIEEQIADLKMKLATAGHLKDETEKYSIRLILQSHIDALEWVLNKN